MFKSSLDRKDAEIAELQEGRVDYIIELKARMGEAEWRGIYRGKIPGEVWIDPISGAEMHFLQAVRLYEFRKKERNA